LQIASSEKIKSFENLYEQCFSCRVRPTKRNKKNITFCLMPNNNDLLPSMLTIN